MSIRSVETNTCPVDGWLGVSAGGRAAAVREGTGPVKERPCAPVEEPTGGVVPQWQSYVDAAASRKFDARLGMLGEAAAASDVCVKPVGPGAAIAASMADGTVDRYSPWSDETLLVDLNTCPLTIVDVGSVRDPDDIAEGAGTEGAERAVDRCRAALGKRRRTEAPVA